MPAALPDFIPPMLARPGQPFDSEEHLFEIKWDGTRAQARIEGGRARLTNRRRRGLTGRYPELEFLGEYGDGFLLDGEIVVLHDGKPDFSRLMTREQAQSTLKIAGLAKSMPATYIGLISCTGTGSRSCPNHCASAGNSCGRRQPAGRTRRASWAVTRPLPSTSQRP